MTWNPSVLALAGAILVAGFTMQPKPAPVIQAGRYVSMMNSWTWMLDTATGVTYRWNGQTQAWEPMVLPVPR